MDVSKLKSWVLVVSTGSAPPKSRVGRRGPATLSYLSRPTKRNAPDGAMIAGIPRIPSMTDLDWLGRSNWPKGSRPKRY